MASERPAPPDQVVFPIIEMSAQGQISQKLIVVSTSPETQITSFLSKTVFDSNSPEQFVGQILLARASGGLYDPVRIKERRIKTMKNNLRCFSCMIALMS